MNADDVAKFLHDNPDFFTNFRRNQISQIVCIPFNDMNPVNGLA